MARSQPSTTQPTTTQPTATQPTATQPTATQPTATQPTASQPPGPLPSAAGAVAPEVVVVHGDGVRVDRLERDVPVAEARSQHGGVDLRAVLVGTLAAVGLLAVLSSLVGAVASVALDDLGDATVPAVVMGLVLLTVSLVVGGWTAGRVARYDGVRNGLLTGALFIVLAAALTALAAANEDVRDVGLPSFSFDGGTALAVVGAALAVLLVLGAAAYGGRLGAGWHRRVDGLLLSTRPGGLEAGR